MDDRCGMLLLVVVVVVVVGCCFFFRFAVFFLYNIFIHMFLLFVIVVLSTQANVPAFVASSRMACCRCGSILNFIAIGAL